MTTKPKTRKAPAADPIFALIKEHKAAEKERCRADEKRDLAQPEAQKKHLSEPGADREQIEKEYRVLKTKLAAAIIASTKYDQRAGLTSLSAQYEAAERAEERAATRLVRTKPTTPAGAVALLNYGSA